MLPNPFDVVHEGFNSTSFRGANAGELAQPAYGEPGNPVISVGDYWIPGSLATLGPRNDESVDKGATLFRRLGRGARRVPRLVSGCLLLHPADRPDRGLI